MAASSSELFSEWSSYERKSAATTGYPFRPIGDRFDSRFQDHPEILRTSRERIAKRGRVCARRRLSSAHYVVPWKDRELSYSNATFPRCLDFERAPRATGMARSPGWLRGEFHFLERRRGGSVRRSPVCCPSSSSRTCELSRSDSRSKLQGGRT